MAHFAVTGQSIPTADFIPGGKYYPESYPNMQICYSHPQTGKVHECDPCFIPDRFLLHSTSSSPSLHTRANHFQPKPEDDAPIQSYSILFPTIQFQSSLCPIQIIPDPLGSIMFGAQSTPSPPSPLPRSDPSRGSLTVQLVLLHPDIKKITRRTAASGTRAIALFKAHHMLAIVPTKLEVGTRLTYQEGTTQGQYGAIRDKRSLNFNVLYFWPRPPTPTTISIIRRRRPPGSCGNFQSKHFQTIPNNPRGDSLSKYVQIIPRSRLCLQLFSSLV